MESSFFIAIDLSLQATTQIRRWIDHLEIAVPEGLRIVNPRQIHLTMQFLGHCNQIQIDQLIILLPQALKKIMQFKIVISKVGIFGSRSHPRVIWAGIDNLTASLISIAAIISELVKVVKIEIPDHSKDFYPHITLARVKNLKRRSDLLSWLEKFNPAPITETVKSLTLFESKSANSYRHHIALVTIDLSSQAP